MDGIDYIRMWREADWKRYIARSERLDQILSLIAEKHGISFSYMGEWGVCDREKGLLQSFATFSNAFEFAMGLLERKEINQWANSQLIK